MPTREPSDVDRDLARLVEVCRVARERDPLIVSLRERGVPAKRLARLAGITHQRVYQLANGTTNGRKTSSDGGRNGNGSTG